MSAYLNVDKNNSKRLNPIIFTKPGLYPRSQFRTRTRHHKLKPDRFYNADFSTEELKFEPIHADIQKEENDGG